MKGWCRHHCSARVCFCCSSLATAPLLSCFRCSSLAISPLLSCFCSSFLATAPLLICLPLRGLLSQTPWRCIASGGGEGPAGGAAVLGLGDPCQRRPASSRRDLLLALPPDSCLKPRCSCWLAPPWAGSALPWLPAQVRQHCCICSRFSVGESGVAAQPVLNRRAWGPCQHDLQPGLKQLMYQKVVLVTITPAGAYCVIFDGIHCMLWCRSNSNTSLWL